MQGTHSTVLSTCQTKENEKRETKKNERMRMQRFVENEKREKKKHIRWWWSRGEEGEIKKADDVLLL